MTGTSFRAAPGAAPVAFLVYTCEAPAPPLTSALIQDGYSVLERRYVEGAEELVSELAPDVIVLLLDPDRPEDLEPLRRLSAIANERTQLLVLAPTLRDSVLLSALNGGAHVCLGSSIAPSVVVAQVRAMRRVQLASAFPGEGSIVSVRDLVIDFPRRRVSRNDRTIPLTKSEFDILGVLARNLGQVVSASEILVATGQSALSESQARVIVKVHLSHLRQKLAAGNVRREYVETIRGVGYLFDRREPSLGREPVPTLSYAGSA